MVRARAAAGPGRVFPALDVHTSSARRRRPGAGDDRGDEPAGADAPEDERRTTRPDGRSSRRIARQSEMKPGAIISAPASSMIAPSTSSADGTSPGVDGALQPRSTPMPSRLTSQAPTTLTAMSSRSVSGHADPAGHLHDHVELDDRHDEEEHHQQHEHRGSLPRATVLPDGDRGAGRRTPTRHEDRGRPTAGGSAPAHDGARAGRAAVLHERRRRRSRRRALRVLRVPARQDRGPGRRLRPQLQRRGSTTRDRREHEARRRRGQSSQLDELQKFAASGETLSGLLEKTTASVWFVDAR